MAEEPKKWKRFEKKAFEIQKSISPASADVKFGDSVLGVDSKTNRQIDISIRTNVGSYSILIVVECKDFKTPVDVPTLEAFISVIRDVRANKGVMISGKGFTAPAQVLGAHHDIDLLRLIDTESVEWGADVSLPSLLERTYIKAFSLMFSDFMEIPMRPTEQIALEVASEDGKKLGTIESILHKKWESKEIPHEPGIHTVVIGRKLHNEFNGVKQTVDVDAGVEVRRAYYYGPVPIHFQGFLNIRTGGTITPTFRTGVISPYEIEMGKVPNWEQISGPSKLSQGPALTIGYSDTYSDGSKWVEGTDSVWPTQSKEDSQA